MYSCIRKLCCPIFLLLVSCNAYAFDFKQCLAMTVNGNFVQLDALKFISLKEGLQREMNAYKSKNKLTPAAEDMFQALEMNLLLVEKDFSWYWLFSRTYQPSYPVNKDTDKLAGDLISGMYRRLGVELPTAISVIGAMIIKRPNFGKEMVDFGVSIRKHTPHCH